MIDRHRRKHPRGSGFTLIELLIAVAILGLLFTAAFGSLSIGARSWETGIARADDNQDVRRSVDFLRRQFGQLTPLTWSEDRARHIVFSGTPEMTSFVAPAPASVAGGLVVVSLVVERQAGGASIRFGIAPLDPGNRSELAAVAPWQRTLSTALANATLSYFGSPYDDEVVGWHREWQADATRYPTIVRITSIAADGTQQPDLLFRIQSQAQT